MKVLVVGGGGREHALVWALQRSGRRSSRKFEVICAPGNGGIAAMARCLPADAASVVSVLAVVEAERPALVVIGPEAPLAAGLVDALRARGIRAFGPTAAAARLETSKAYAKDFMIRWQIPTATYRVCRSVAEVDRALPAFAPGVVVKADGLAAGKGVVLCGSHSEALAVAEGLLAGTLPGGSGGSVVLEELLTGPEISYFAVCDGRYAVRLAAAQDHKRIGEGDTGPNTGGMGAYSTDTLLTPPLEAELLGIARRVVSGMAAEGAPFQGILFIGVMLTPAGPRVLEFNTRFGDPETEAILPRLKTPLLDILEAALDGRLEQVSVRLRPGASASVVAASAGYPGSYAVGHPIHGLDTVPAGVEVFHAGTALQQGQTVTAGGRVLAVTATGADLEEALSKVYGALTGISFEGMQYRRDIGWRALS